MKYIFNFKEDGTFINKNRYGITVKTLDAMFEGKEVTYPTIYSYDSGIQAWAKRVDGPIANRRWQAINEEQVPETILVQLRLLFNIN